MRRHPNERQYPGPIRIYHSGARLRCAAHVFVDRSAYSTIEPSAEEIMETMHRLQEVRTPRGHEPNEKGRARSLIVFAALAHNAPTGAEALSDLAALQQY
jgi:hypothetical protein